MMYMANSYRKGNIVDYPGHWLGRKTGVIVEVETRPFPGETRVKWAYRPRERNIFSRWARVVELKEAEIQGVQITEKWLKDLNFVCLDQEYGHFYFHGPLEIEFNQYAPFHPIVRAQRAGEAYDIKYIHELQNLYYGVTGQDFVSKWTI